MALCVTQSMRTSAQLSMNKSARLSQITNAQLSTNKPAAQFKTECVHPPLLRTARVAVRETVQLSLTPSMNLSAPLPTIRSAQLPLNPPAGLSATKSAPPSMTENVQTSMMPSA